MTAPMRLAEVRRLELNEKIDALVAKGDVKLLEVAEHEVVAELARREFMREIARRGRRNTRARERFDKVRDEANAKLRAKVRMTVDVLARDLHAEWSQSLLLSEFSLPDGTRVTFRAATIAQHEMRAAHLESLAAGDLHTASIHRRAVADIQAANAHDLSGALA